MNDYSEKLIEAKNIVGSWKNLGAICGLSGKAVEKWSKNGRPPRTEYTGETDYARMISDGTGDVISRDSLLPKLNVENVFRL